jgi:hypothetical protein
MKLALTDEAGEGDIRSKRIVGGGHERIIGGVEGEVSWLHDRRRAERVVVVARVRCTGPAYDR